MGMTQEEFLKKYELKSLEEAAKLLNDFDKCCQDLINLSTLCLAQGEFIKSKGLHEESKKYIKGFVESVSKYGTSTK